MSDLPFELSDKRLDGNRAESEFVDAVLHRKPNTVVMKSSTDQDRNGHFDFLVNDYKVDVKARKNMGVLNHDFQKYCVLELQDVYGKRGWLYGDADYIAFEITNFFVVCPRLELVDYVEKHVKDEFVIDSNDAINKKYTRFGAVDIITAVPWDEIQTENCFAVRKINYDDNNN